MRPKFTQGLLDEQNILAHLALRPGRTILDAGCGNGYMAEHFARLVGPAGTVYALDIDENRIKDLRRALPAPNIVPLLGDITRRTELAEGSLYLIYLSTVFHIFSPAQVAGFDAEVRRLLKPGGRLAVVTFNKEETNFGPPLSLRLSPEELCRQLSLRPAGLTTAGEHFYLQLFQQS